LRTQADREALWKAIESGLIDSIGSDNVPRVKAAKQGDIWKAAAGFPGMETILPIFVSEAHIKRRIPLERVVDLLSTNPAQIFGLTPRKGAIRLGADADFAVVDLNNSYVIEADKLHSVAGYSIYEGWTVNCRPVHTLLRGKFVQRDGVLQVAERHGKYCSRPKTCYAKEVKSE
jgi:dihydroorotase-like cyclic amidohydrolase